MNQHLVVSASGVSKIYPTGRTAVDQVSFIASRGEVVGLVGHNGAGKTTLLKMLVGLLKPTSGSISILGHQPGSEQGLACVGSMIEAPAFYPYLSGKDNLMILADYCAVSKERVREVLGVSGLGDRANDRTSTYSMGMKQRLGVAAALLKHPPLLILDEPTNGLDPDGIETVYSIIRQYRDDGNTVFFCSHQIDDVVKICDRICVFRGGRLIADQPVSAFACQDRIVIHTLQPERALNILLSLYGPSVVSRRESHIWVSTDSANAHEIARVLINGDATILDIRVVTDNHAEAVSALMNGLSDSAQIEPRGALR